MKLALVFLAAAAGTGTVVVGNQLATKQLSEIVTERDASRSGDALPPENPTIARAIPSDASDALREPEFWTCSYLLPEYQAWLEGGNDPNDWSMVGKTYRNAETGELYTWIDWLDWIDEHKCAPDAIARPEALQLLGPILGPALGAGAAVGTGFAASRNDSPG